MDSGNYLARIDSLCTRDLAGEHSGSDVFMAGSGYCIVSLEVSHELRTEDASRRVRTEAELHALKEDISLMLNARWGEQHPLWWMGTIVVRIDRGEVIAEPWATVSTLVDELHLWQPEGKGRWIAIGVADRDVDDEVHLLAVVTETDPPWGPAVTACR
ncbi:hypothetical protein AB0I77_42520 [Streptomyces sp. NPDC050619]|uniref:hypothetical protein n=1 Tax=Streptomyces sp. NPDC050619 TaxID=3157214 RepID=UPI0034419F5F